MRNVLYEESPPETRRIYDALKESLQTTHIPLFFTYLGAYPEYLSFISDQLLANIKDDAFFSLHSKMSKDTLKLTHSLLPESEERKEWLARYRHSPSFYNLEKDVEHTYHINMTLALLFIALREAVKGWAIAVKQLDATQNQDFEKKKEDIHKKDKEFILEGIISPLSPLLGKTGTRSDGVILKEERLKDPDRKWNENWILSQRDPFGKHSAQNDSNTAYEMEKNLFVEYLTMNEKEYFYLLKQEHYLYLRVYIEKLLLVSLPLLPHPIVSPINAVFELASKYKDFPDLLYLLSEHFPTLAVQRLIYSGYLLPLERS